MSGLLVVIPVIAEFTADVCLPSMLTKSSAAGFDPEDVLVVDNSRDGFAAKYGVRTYRDPDGRNLGTSRAWNVGAREVLDRGLDYLVIASTSMQFGPALHTTWLDQLKTFWGENVIEAEGHSWHAIAFHRRVFEKIGLFDENLYPAYVEGLDLSLRMRRVDWEGGWRRIWFNALSLGHGLHVNIVKCPFDALNAYYIAKWGGPKGEETFTLPFGDKPLDYWEDVPIPVLAERYGLGEYGVGWW